MEIEYLSKTLIRQYVNNRLLYNNKQMNRLFGTKKKDEPKIAAPAKEEEKQVDLVEQSKKVQAWLTIGRKQSQRD